MDGGAIGVSVLGAGVSVLGAVPGVMVAVPGGISVPFTTGVAVITTPPVVPAAGVPVAVGAPPSLHPARTYNKLAADTVKSVFFTINSIK